MEVLTNLFGQLHKTTLFRMINHVQWRINSTFASLIQWPTAEERRDLYGYFAVYDKAVAILDGTHLPINRPVRDGQPFWSTY